MGRLEELVKVNSRIFTELVDTLKKKISDNEKYIKKEPKVEETTNILKRRLIL